MMQIPLSRGLLAIVDDADFTTLSAHKWYAHVGGRGKVYAARKVANGMVNGRTTYTVEYMHHAVAGKPENGVVDHENRNSLDNRRANLVPKSQSQNVLNSSHSDAKGVFLCSLTGRYAARASAAGRRHFLGRYDTEAEAVAAVDAFRCSRTKPGTRTGGQRKKKTAE